MPAPRVRHIRCAADTLLQTYEQYGQICLDRPAGSLQSASLAASAHIVSCAQMFRRIRYFRTDNADSVMTDQDLQRVSDIEIEPSAALPSQQGLALLISLQTVPQLKGHNLQVRAPLGDSTIWRPLQEVRVLPTNKVLDVRAVKGMPSGSFCTLSNAVVW